ncbi:uncharacterized protein [Littorina saxatilis]|uniref:uncharacterized protein n=1 Tax=Littorina saxatilis TaxID=31220 RepID=UPI0038B5B0F5
MHSTQQRPRPRQKDDPYDQVEIDSQFVSAQKPDTDNAFTDSKARFRIKTDPYDEVEEQVGTGTFCFKKTDPYDQTGHSNGSQEPFRREMSDPYDRVADDITRPKQNRFQVKGDYQHLSLKSDARNQTSKAVEGDSSKVGNVYSRIGAPGVLKTTDAAGTDTDDSVDVYNRLKTAEQRPQNSTSSDDSYHRIGDIDVLKTTREVCSSDYNRVVRTKGTGTTHDIVTQVEAMDSQQATKEIEQNGYSRFSKRTSVRDRSTIKDNHSHIGRSGEREKTALTETDGQ